MREERRGGRERRISVYEPLLMTIKEHSARIRMEGKRRGGSLKERERKRDTTDGV